MHETQKYAIGFFGCVFAFIFWNEVAVLPFHYLDPLSVGLLTNRDYERRAWLNLPLVGISFLLMAGGAYSAIGLYESTLTEEAKELEYRHLVMGFQALPSSLRTMKEAAKMMVADLRERKQQRRIKNG